MKILKFRKYLVPLVLSGSKSATWRLFDDKNISVGDVIELQEFLTNKVFGKASIVDVVEKSFGELNNDDKTGYEDFDSDEEMYATYSMYYKTEVNQNTKLKIIRFELIN